MPEKKRPVDIGELVRMALHPLMADHRDQVIAAFREAFMSPEDDPSLKKAFEQREETLQRVMALSEQLRIVHSDVLRQPQPAEQKYTAGESRLKDLTDIAGQFRETNARLVMLEQYVRKSIEAVNKNTVASAQRHVEIKQQIDELYAMRTADAKFGNGLATRLDRHFDNLSQLDAVSGGHSKIIGAQQEAIEGLRKRLDQPDAGIGGVAKDARGDHNQVWAAVSQHTHTFDEVFRRLNALERKKRKPYSKT